MFTSVSERRPAFPQLSPTASTSDCRELLAESQITRDAVAIEIVVVDPGGHHSQPSRWFRRAGRRSDARSAPPCAAESSKQSMTSTSRRPRLSTRKAGRGPHNPHGVARHPRPPPRGHPPRRWTHASRHRPLGGSSLGPAKYSRTPPGPRYDRHCKAKIFVTASRIHHRGNRRAVANRRRCAYRRPGDDRHRHCRRLEPPPNSVCELAAAGAEMVRISIDRPEAAAAVPAIRKRLMIWGATLPLVGDFHYNGHILLRKDPVCARTLDKFRINPGTVGAASTRDGNFDEICTIARDHDKAIRIGVNSGSLDPRLSPLTMAENASARNRRSSRRRSLTTAWSHRPSSGPLKHSKPVSGKTASSYRARRPTLPA